MDEVRINRICNRNRSAAYSGAHIRILNERGSSCYIFNWNFLAAKGESKNIVLPTFFSSYFFHWNVLKTRRHLMPCNVSRFFNYVLMNVSIGRCCAVLYPRKDIRYLFKIKGQKRSFPVFNIEAYRKLFERKVQTFDFTKFEC